ncbi:hypothetical protein [Brevibacillus sp. 179-C9.3 HS]|uniref:hypothetical protein n=1 Tax=unclassified Brevibacillus TaxID=2684853 RepID=UPI0039A204E1
MINEIEFNKGINKLKRDSFQKFCFFGLGCENEKIIKAHSIQENKILSNISEEGKVLHVCHEIDEGGLSFDFKIIGKGIASTFTGFCKTHDTKIFQPIEIYDYQFGNKEQEFLFAYRALAIGHFKKKYHEHVINLLYRSILANDLEAIYKYFPQFNNLSSEYMFKLGLAKSAIEETCRKLEKLRSSFNTNLKNKKYHHIETKVIVYEIEYHIAVSSYIILPYDFEGRKLNSSVPIFLSVFPENGKTYVLLSYLKKESNFLNFLDSQLFEQSPDFQRKALSNIIARYVSNFYLSPIRWAHLSRTEKEKTLRLLNKCLSSTPNDNRIDINLFY